MKNSELIKLLSELPPDADVLMASDPEGNRYHFLEDVESAERPLDDPYREYGPIHPDDLWEYVEDDIETVESIYLWP